MRWRKRKRAGEAPRHANEHSGSERSGWRRRLRSLRSWRPCRVPPDSEHWISESCLANIRWKPQGEEKMAKPSRWTAEKRYQIVKEALSQKEPMAQIARRDQVSEALI